MNEILSNPWYVLSVRPRSERKVETVLRAKGIEAITPVQKQWRQWSDRRKCVEVVIFTNYVFVSPSPEQIEEVLNYENVFGYICIGQKKACLTEPELMLIKRLCKQEAPVEITYSRFDSGQKVEIVSGALRGLQGIIREIRGNQRLILQIPRLGCCAHVEVRNMEVKAL